MGVFLKEEVNEVNPVPSGSIVSTRAAPRVLTPVLLHCSRSSLPESMITSISLG